MFIRQSRQRRGVAATEMALLAPVLIVLLMGIWEVGRMIMIRNLLDEATREGGRLAASAVFFAGSNRTHPEGGPLILIPPSKNETFEVPRKVLLYLRAAGVNTSNATVSIRNQGNPATSLKNWSCTFSPNGSQSSSGFDPAAAADQHDHLIITVSVPYRSIAWSPLFWFINENTTLSSTAHWTSLRDIPLTISTNIPTRPLQPTDPLP